MAEKLVVTTFVKNLLGGGAERVAVNLLQGLPQDLFTQELVMVDAWGPFLEQVPPHVKQTNLALGDNVTGAISHLVRYLRERKPDILISHLAHANVAAVIAATCARTDTKVILVEHNDNTLLDQARTRSKASNLMQRFKSLSYNRADTIIGVSQGVSEYVSRTFKVPMSKVETIYNPVVSRSLLERSQEPLTHPWFAPGEPPVLVGSGRLREQKDFPTLLKAFARVRAQLHCRLLILGEGEGRPALEAEVAALGLQDDVALPGFVENPYAYMRNAALFVLSSRWEGLPTVLVEAMACGCPVVATDCPSGPAEILEDGALGQLVEMADPDELAQAIVRELNAPTPAERLEARASRFSFDNAIAAYTQLLLDRAAQPAGRAGASPRVPVPAQPAGPGRAGLLGRRALQPGKTEAQKRRNWWG
jgi:glycosyltransferase involved in cell wall biosynthesis